MKTTVWAEPMTHKDMHSVRYYDPETGKVCRVTTYSNNEKKLKMAEIKVMLMSRRGGKGNPDALPLSVFQTYLESLKGTHRPQTLNLKHDALNGFLTRVPRLADLVQYIPQWKASMVEGEYANDTVGIRLREMRAFANWLVKHGYLPESPMKDISIPSSTFVGRRITVDELQRMYIYAGETFRPFFVLAVETGARRGELLGIRWSELDLVQGYWSIPAERCKTKRGRTIPLSKPAVAALELVLRTTDALGPVFLGWSTFKVKYHWKKMLIAADIEGRVRLHDVRHTFASNFRGRASSLKAICGWTTDAMANKYTHTTVDELREDMDKFGVNLGRNEGKSE